MASSFWVGFFEEFDLSSVRFCNLASSDDSGGSDMINDELLTALAQAHDPNPAQRRVDNFTNYLEHSGPCTLTELKFMICSSRESPTITRKNSLNMLVHILRFIGKHQLHTKWAAFWSTVTSDFDCSFAAHVSHSPPCPAIRAQFVQGLRFAFEPDLPYECFRAVEAAAAAKGELPVTPLRSILATQVGALLYKGEGVAMRYKMYIQTIEGRLQQLEDLGYLEEDLQGFRSVVVQEAKLVMESSSSFERKQCVLKYLGENMEIQIVSINDEWSFRLLAMGAVVVRPGRPAAWVSGDHRGPCQPSRWDDECAHGLQCNLRGLRVDTIRRQGEDRRQPGGLAQRLGPVLVLGCTFLAEPREVGGGEDGEAAGDGLLARRCHDGREEHRGEHGAGRRHPG